MYILSGFSFKHRPCILIVKSNFSTLNCGKKAWGRLIHEVWHHLFYFQICHKINQELVYARNDLQHSLKVGGDVTTARKRVSWLEDRMERLLGKKRQRVCRNCHKHERIRVYYLSIMCCEVLDVASYLLSLFFALNLLALHKKCLFL